MISESLENSEDKTDDSESLIHKTLDIFLFVPLLSFLPSKYITRQFISGFLLSVFLVSLYYANDLLILNWSFHMIALYVIIFLTIAELTRKNIPILNKYFSNDQKSMTFLKNIDSKTDGQMIEFVKFHIFSSKCINKILMIHKEDTNKIPPDIFDYILTTQDLTKENLDLMFSKEIIPQIDEEIIIFTLFQKTNQLTEQNIRNIYERFKDNKKGLKTLFATQSQSKILIDTNSNNEITQYFNKFQKQKLHLDFILKLFPISWFFICNRKFLRSFLLIFFTSIFTFILSLIFSLFSTLCYSPDCSLFVRFLYFFSSLWIIVFLLLTIPMKYLEKYLARKYFSHLQSRIESVSFIDVDSQKGG